MVLYIGIYTVVQYGSAHHWVRGVIWGAHRDSPWDAGDVPIWASTGLVVASTMGYNTGIQHIRATTVHTVLGGMSLGQCAVV